MKLVRVHRSSHPEGKPKPCTEQDTLRPLQNSPPLTTQHPISLYIQLHLSAIRHNGQVEKVSAGTGLIQPITPNVVVAYTSDGYLRDAYR
jgi:hypothetical protein